MNNTENTFSTRFKQLVAEIVKAYGQGETNGLKFIAKELGRKDVRQFYNWGRGKAIPHQSDGVIRKIEAILLKAKSGTKPESPENTTSLYALISQLDARISEEIKELKREIAELKKQEGSQQIPKEVYLLKRVFIKEEP